MFCLFYVCLYTTQHGVLADAPRDLAVSLTLTRGGGAIVNLISIARGDRGPVHTKSKTQSANRRSYRRVIIERNDSTLETAHLEAKLLEEPLVLARLEGGGVPAGGRRG
eukprot:scaffold46994_cov30-Phaeocystis_antarctica.AAC.1